MDLQPSLCLPAFQIESQSEFLSTPSSSDLSTTAHEIDNVSSDRKESEGIGLDQDQQLERPVTEEDYREKTLVPPQTKLQVEIFNRICLNMDQQEDELTPLSSSESSVNDEPPLQTQPITPSSSNLSSTIALPTIPIPCFKPILIRYFYPIDPVTSLQQQEPVYDDPRYPAVRPIPEWPPPELVEWRKGKRNGRRRNVAGTKRKTADMMSSDEDEDYSGSSTCPIKRVRWKSVDDVSFFEPVPPITVNLLNKPFVSLPVQGPVNGTLYRAISISTHSPPPSENEEEETSLGRGKRRRAPNRMLTYPVNTQSRKRVSFSASEDDFKPITPKAPLKIAGGRVCHQCRRSNIGPPKPKMKCSFIKADGSQCVLQYCESCIMIRYDEPFEPSSKTWICPFCREICNCSLCLRKNGFGYIWDGALANDLKHQRLRYRVRLQNMPKNAKSANETVYVDKPSMRKWLARRGVVTGSATWMAQRRKEGRRFVVGRTPSPQPDSSIFVGDCAYVAEFEKANESKDEGEGETLDTDVVDGIVLTGPTNPPSESQPTDTPPSSNSFDVFAQSKGRFFVGKVLKRKISRSQSQAKQRDGAALPRRSSGVSSTRTSPDGVKDDPQCTPQPMMILRPPSKSVGFYADIHNTENETLSEEETESTNDPTVKQQVYGAVVQEGHGSEEDAEGTSDDDVVAQWPAQPENNSNLAEPPLSYSTSTPTSTSTSKYTTLYSPPSSYAGPPSPSRAFQLLLGVPLIQPEYSRGLNARGLELERRERRESYMDHCSADRNGRMVNVSSIDNIPDGVEKTPFDSHIISPSQDPVNSGVDEFTMPLPLPLPIPGYDDALKGTYDSSGFDTWIMAENIDEDGTDSQGPGSSPSGTL